MMGSDYWQLTLEGARLQITVRWWNVGTWEQKQASRCIGCFFLARCLPASSRGASSVWWDALAAEWLLLWLQAPVSMGNQLFCIHLKELVGSKEHQHHARGGHSNVIWYCGSHYRETQGRIESKTWNRVLLSRPKAKKTDHGGISQLKKLRPLRNLLCIKVIFLEF